MFRMKIKKKKKSKKKTYFIIGGVILFLLISVMTILHTPQGKIVRDLFPTKAEGVMEQAGVDIGNSKSNITYTPYSSDTVKSDGSHEFVGYSGFTFTDDNGTKIEDTASLKDCQFCDEINLIIKEDKKFPININDIVDFNSTSITVCPKVAITELNKDIPLKTTSYFCNDSLFTITQNCSEIVHYNTLLNFKTVNDNKCQTIPFGLGKEIKWGTGTTTIVLNGTTQTWDNYMESDTSQTCYSAGIINSGGMEYFMVGDTGSGGDYIRETLIKFNLSSIPSNANIISANLSLNLWLNRLEGSEQEAGNIYRILRDWGEGSGVGMSSETNASCSAAFKLDCGADCANAGNWTICNARGIDTDYNTSLLANRTISTGQTGWITWNFSSNGTDVFQGWVDGSYDNYGFKLAQSRIDTNDDDRIIFRSSEYSTIAETPRISIVYTVPSSCTCTDAQNWEISMSDYCNHTTACHPLAVTFINTGWFNCSSILNCTSFGNLANNQKVFVAPQCQININ